MNCDGIDDYLTIAHEASIDFADENFTLLAWVNPDYGGPMTLGRIVDKHVTTPGQQGYLFGVDDLTANETLGLGVNNASAGAYILAPATSLSNAWHAVAAKYSASLNEGQIWVDGTSVVGPTGFGADAIAAGNTPLSLCARSTGTGYGYVLDGQLTSVLMIQGALSDLWIRRVYHSRLADPPLPYTVDVRLRLPMRCRHDNPTNLHGVVLQDRSPYRNNATASHGTNASGMTCDNTDRLLGRRGVE